MCGRYGRRGDKQKIAEAFHISTGLDEVDIPEDLDCAPGSIQPVVSLSDEGERALSLMRWGFKLPDRLLFNTRSEGVERANFWKKMFTEHRCLIPASSFYEWEKIRNGCKPKYEITIPGFAWPLAFATLKTESTSTGSRCCIEFPGRFLAAGEDCIVVPPKCNSMCEALALVWRVSCFVLVLRGW